MINSVTLTGRLTKDPDLKYSPSGVAITSFTVAVNRTFQNQQGEREADFINCVCFKRVAENLANYQKKGNLIGIEGRIQTRSYDDNNGNKRYVTEVVANNVHFLESKKQDNQTNSQFESKGESLDVKPEDLPF